MLYAEKAVTEYSPGNILSFTRSLINQKEYYRASQELNRLRTYHPQAITATAYTATQDYLYFKSGTYKHILRRTTTTGLEGYINALYTCDAYFKTGKFKSAYRTVSALRKTASKSAIDPFIIKRYMLTSLLLDRHIGKTELDSHSFAKYRELLRYKNSKYSEMKSPLVALGLGFVPGMGYWYSGLKSTGFVAVFIIAVNTALTYFAYTTGNEAMSYITGTIGVLFYTGSIIGGYMETRKYNKQIVQTAGDYIADELQLEKDHDLLYYRYGIGKNK